ncbi:hypothetical protein DFS34DRAFT_585200 [Phlyctochytrium arcticum]|nr:hypothetical protein DFS34DRAFT_585200 [Phlyctochytrium arcticum]
MQGFSTGSVGSPSKPLQKQLLRPSYNLWVHDERFSKQDLVLNPDCFPGVKVGDLLEIFHPIAVNSGSNTTSSSNAGHASATSAGRTTARQGSKSPSSKPRHSGPGTGTDREKTLVLQISIAQHVAALFELQARTDVVVRRVEKESIAAHFIELNFRDQYVGRSDMWRLKTLLTGTCVYQGKKITSLGIRAQIKDVVVGGRKVACAYITENTKTIFRSETAKYFLFVQMSREMWEFDEDGELYFEKCVHGFLPQLFARWKDLGANHVVSIVLFARIYYHNNQEDADMGKKLSLFEEDVVDADDSQSIPILIDGHGRPYRDFYRVVVDWEIRSDWSHVLIPLKKEFISFQRDVLQQPTLDGSTILAGANSTASEGNILEAINLALNPFDRHYIDRDLSRTGLSIVIVTPGPGLFEADKKLLRLTAQRMVDNGIGLDLVCLNKPPLYTVPLFQFMSKDWAGSSGGGWGMPGTSGELDATVGGGDKRWSTGGSGTTFGKASDRSFERKGATIPSQFATGSGSGLAGASTGSERRLEAWDPLYYDDSSPDNPDKMFYGVPHWVMCSFWTRDEGANKFGFALRCKMYEVQMMGVMEQIGSTIVAPYLDKTAGPVVDMSIGAAVLENEAMHAEAAQEKGGRQLQHRQTQDTIRSVDSDNANTQRPPLHYGSTFYHPWEDSDTMTTEERMALLKAKARIDLVRQPSQSNVGGPLRSVQSYTSLTNVPHTGSKVSIANSDPFESGKLQRMPWQQPANPNLARKGMRIASDSTGVAELKPVRDSAARASYDGSDAGQPEPVDAEDAPVVGSSTSLAPIRIHSSASHLNVRPHRDALSGSGSYKGGHSPLNNFDYLRQYPKLSPGKTSNQALRSVLHSSVRPNFINPSNPSRNAIRATNQVFRWQHAFPYVNVPARADTIIHWKSLSTPACLPITTDYFPSAEELSELYVEYTYTVSPADDATPYQSRGDANSGRSETFRIEALLTELVGQRLAQGFQLIVNSATVSPINSRQSDKQGSKRLLGSLSEMSQRQLRNSTVQRLSNPTPPQQNLNASLSSESLPSFPISVPYYLSLGNHVHRLFYDASGQNVEVKRYVRKITYSTLPVPYACGIWRKNDQFYRPKRLTFTYPPVILYNWNYLDHLISGYQEEMTENLRFWRTRFLLIPLETTSNLNPFLNPQGENLDDEEIRLVGFEKFIEVFERSRWAAKKSKVAKVANKLQIRMTTFSASRFIRDEVLQQKETALNSLILPASTPAPTPVHSQSSNSLITSPLFTKTTPFTTIAQAMQAPPPTGITFCDRRWHFVMYERVFVGSECVDWMVRNFSDIDSREEAVEFGNALLQTGMLEHASRKHRFLDGHYFYRIRSQHLRQGAANHTKDKEKGPSWFAARGRTGSASDSDFPEPGTPSTGPVASHTDATGTTDTSAPPAFAARVEPTPPAERFCLSRRMVIDLDPQRRSPRRETAVLHYDTVHNPRICFHFQLHWLVCSPRWIEDLVAGWARVAEKCGFKMIEAGIEQAEPLSDVNPFQSVTRILPVIDQPALPHASLPATFYLTELVRKFNFVLDVEADSCFPPNSVEWSYDRGRGYKRTQWVHRSGVAFIQIGTAQEGGGFWWVANRMHLTGGGGNKEGSGGKTTLEKNTDPETLRRAFTDFCEDAGALQQFWDDVRSRFHGVFGVAPSSTGKSASDGSTDAEQDQSGERTKSSSSSATSSLQSNARDAPIIQGALTKLTAEVEFEDIGDDAGATVVRVAEGSILDPEFFSPPPHGHQRALSAGTKTVLDDGSTGKTGHGVHLPDGKFEVESKRGDLPKEALGPNGKDGEQLEQRGDA